MQIGSNPRDPVIPESSFRSRDCSECATPVTGVTRTCAGCGVTPLCSGCANACCFDRRHYERVRLGTCLPGEEFVTALSRRLGFVEEDEESPLPAEVRGVPCDFGDGFEVRLHPAVWVLRAVRG